MLAPVVVCLGHCANRDTENARSPDAILEDSGALVASAIQDLRVVRHGIAIRVMVEHPSLVRADH